uniref:DUF4205 domain-containing protein n=1 Tax=Macrostomum lignano TaxID=282301 RepID=A0A1I8FBB6_9PLAT
SRRRRTRAACCSSTAWCCRAASCASRPTGRRAEGFAAQRQRGAGDARLHPAADRAPPAASCTMACQLADPETGAPLPAPRTGLAQRPDVGLLQTRPAVGSMLRSPRFPIWLVRRRGQAGLLFSTHSRLMEHWRSETAFHLYYYTGLASQSDEFAGQSRAGPAALPAGVRPRPQPPVRPGGRQMATRPAERTRPASGVLVTGSSRGIGEALAHVVTPKWELTSPSMPGASTHCRRCCRLIHCAFPHPVSPSAAGGGRGSVHPIAATCPSPARAARLVAAAGRSDGRPGHCGGEPHQPVRVRHCARAARTLHRGSGPPCRRTTSATLRPPGPPCRTWRKSAGSLVLISSAAARLPIPYCYEYCASKRALGGFFSALRQELALNGSAVHAGLALIGSIGTESARRVLPKVLQGEHSAGVAADTPWTFRRIPGGPACASWRVLGAIRPVVLLRNLRRSFVEQQMQSLSRHF